MPVHGELTKLFEKYDIPTTACWSEIGKGWIPILDEMFERLVKTGWDKSTLAQVKQKFCQLRVYIDVRLTEEQKVIVREAENKADHTCEECGALHDLTPPRSGIALCDTCQKNR